MSSDCMGNNSQAQHIHVQKMTFPTFQGWFLALHLSLAVYPKPEPTPLSTSVSEEVQGEVLDEHVNSCFDFIIQKRPWENQLW